MSDKVITFIKKEKNGEVRSVFNLWHKPGEVIPQIKVLELADWLAMNSSLDVIIAPDNVVVAND